MSGSRVSSYLVEAAVLGQADAWVSSYLLEAAIAFPSYSAFSPCTPTLDPGEYGDMCTSTPDIDAAWTLRNATASGDGSKYLIVLDAQGDAMTRAFAEPVVYTASEEYDANWAAWRAADGDPNTDWAANGYTVGDWWKAEFANAQTLTSVTMQCRNSGETLGYGHLEFSSGDNVAFEALVSGTPLTVTFDSRSTTFVKIVSEGGGSGNAGLKQVSFSPGFTSDFCLTAHIRGLTDQGGMIGLCALDSSGNGRAFTTYNNGYTYGWAVSSYAYSSTGNGVPNPSVLTDYWLQLRRNGRSWSGRHSIDASNWSSWTGTDLPIPREAPRRSSSLRSSMGKTGITPWRIQIRGRRFW
jgi:hypothetical protein